MFSARHVRRKPSNNASTGVTGVRLVFFFSVPMIYHIQMRWLSNNEIPSQSNLWNGINNASVDKFFFQTNFFFCSAHIFFIPLQSPPHQRLPEFITATTRLLLFTAGTVVPGIERCELVTVEVFTVDCRQQSVNEIRLQTPNDNKRFRRPKCARSRW